MKAFNNTLVYCDLQYVFYQFDQNYLRSKEKKNDVILIDEDRTKRLPHPVPEEIEKEYSIMFYFTPEFAASKDFSSSRSNTSNFVVGDYFEELVQKTNLGYQKYNISIKAYMHCFEMASIQDSVSDKMSVILDKFKNMKGTPEKLRNLADVAVLFTNDVKDSCGASYGHAYRKGWTFSVTSRDCAISQQTFSHGIAHNFGVDHSSEFLLNKRGKKELVTIHPVRQTRTEKFGVPANYMNFNIIAALGDESCICYSAYQMFYDRIGWHMALNDSCYFHSKGKGKEPASNMLDFQKLDKKIQTFNQKKLQRRKEKKKNLYSNFLKNRQKLFKNYIKTAQKLFRNYLKDAHSKGSLKKK